MDTSQTSLQTQATKSMVLKVALMLVVGVACWLVLAPWPNRYSQSSNVRSFLRTPSYMDHEKCLQTLQNKLDQVNADDDVGGLMYAFGDSLKPDTTMIHMDEMKGIDQEYTLSVADLDKDPKIAGRLVSRIRKQQHKAAVTRTGDLVVSFSDNTVAVVDAVTCSIKNIYMPTSQGHLHPEIESNAINEKNVAVDKCLKEGKACKDSAFKCCDNMRCYRSTFSSKCGHPPTSPPVPTPRPTPPPMRIPAIIKPYPPGGGGCGCLPGREVVVSAGFQYTAAPRGVSMDWMVYPNGRQWEYELAFNREVRCFPVCVPKSIVDTTLRVASPIIAGHSSVLCPVGWVVSGCGIFTHRRGSPNDDKWVAPSKSEPRKCECYYGPGASCQATCIPAIKIQGRQVVEVFAHHRIRATCPGNLKAIGCGITMTPGTARHRGHGGATYQFPEFYTTQDKKTCEGYNPWGMIMRAICGRIQR